ncbi:inactive tyrosine-protein kinase PRAG1 isoform X2 [Microcaecilia unicolor]|nr:inactive tyrosine-protein kinase PRAG1 isoform X2 [Microcaecilia unicolor]XP_030050389.1 inactive tyrosine-protein kinase PRAG1 isoform X2 [Microcaecilia unicolor]XP_030050390.1 inactive tyrosine-protein kinase PRAG1 isoform X2 [Microcaecilia unicolor]XP_030050391.1 inactive tyrosine-protein kinase PRAG1 isoform X2 [Microcaecilia unicolor]
MHAAVALNGAGLKMSACSEFVEHVWKPGSCKNCFYPRASHRLLQPLCDPGVSTLPASQGPNGAGIKGECASLEDDSVAASLYSKPTIAVKPTMMSLDASDAWLEVNMNADNIPQVSWRMPLVKQSILKSSDEKRNCFDNLRRDPSIQSTAEDGSSHYSLGHSLMGLQSSESKMERTGFVSEVGGQDNRSAFLCKEMLTVAKESFHQDAALSHERYVGCKDLIGCPPFQPTEGTAESPNGTNGYSPGFKGEGGDYCQIKQCYSNESLLHGTALGETKSVLHGNTSSNPVFCNQDASVNSRTKMGRPLKTSDEGSFVNLGLSLQEEHSLLVCLQNSCLERKKGSLVSESSSLSDALSFDDGGDGAVAASHEATCHSQARELDLPENPKAGSSAESLLHPQKGPGTGSHVTHPVQPSQSEPIYAEITKRKKAPLGNAGTSAKTDRPLTLSSCKEPVRGTCEQSTHHWSAEREHHDTSPQVPAKITVMAAHAEEENRTIYLSSPDSAVGVQWSSLSPASNPDSGSLSPFFQWGEGCQASKGLGQSGDGHKLCTQAAIRSPVTPSNMSKTSQLISEGSRVPLINSPVSELCDTTNQCTDGALSSTRSTLLGADTSASGMPGSPSHSLNKSMAEIDKCLPSIVADRRRMHHGAPWIRQCRIDEEEEEEPTFSHQLKTQGKERGASFTSSNTIHPHAEDCSLQGNKLKEGMSKSASCPFELTKDRSKTEGFTSPPPPPPKKQSRHILKMNKSSSELEKFSHGSTESLPSPSRAPTVRFIAGSTDSLASDTRTEGGLSCEVVQSPMPPSPVHGMRKLSPSASFPTVSSENPQQGGTLQPPPLPQKKTVSRAASAPDNSSWNQASPGRRTGNASSPKLSLSHPENVCSQEASQFSCPSSPGDNHPLFSSCESLEKGCRGQGHRNRSCLQNRAMPTFSSSQLSVSSHVSSGSSLQLHHLLSNIDSKEGVYSKLGGLYAESLRRLAARCEDTFMRDQKTELHFDETNWSLFKLTCNKPCCDAGDAIYYCATCAKDPQNNYAIKICKAQESKTASYCSLSLPIHFNIQQDCGHFLASVPSSMIQSPEILRSTSTTGTNEHECIVVITREVPHQTAADYVKDSVSDHRALPEMYERQVCLLLLQLCNGLEHLKEHGIIHRDLCLENLLLVHCKPSASCGKPKSEKHLPRLIVSNFSKAKQRSGAMDSRLKKDQARLAPEIVSASQYKKFDEFQTGILIYELLHQPNPFEERAFLTEQEQEYSQEDLPPLPNLSIYSQGLQQLAHLLLEADPIKRIRITEAKRILQCLLWGPRKDLTSQPFCHEEALHSALQNWIDMKRALMMMKFAERALDPERGIELEDWLCCQYLASADPCFLYHTLRQLQLL